MKRSILFGICAFFACFFSMTAAMADVFPVTTTATAGCPATPNYYDSNFCSSFPAVATCQCKQEGGPAGWCTSAHQIYKNMITFFHTISNGCDYAISKGVIPASDREACIDRWSCYINGGSYDGHACSGSGVSCPGNG